MDLWPSSGGFECSNFIEAINIRNGKSVEDIESKTNRQGVKTTAKSD